MDPQEQAHIIRRCQAGDRAAFQALVDAYSPRLYGYIFRMVGSKIDAEDILQELFLRVVRNLADYRHDSRLDAWLFRIATNLVRDRVRRRRASPLFVTDDAGPEDAGRTLDAQPGQEPSPHAQLERAEDIDRLQAALARLPQTDREIILLRYFAQLSFKEIAQQLECPLGTALARVHRGMKKLRQLMESSHDD